VQFVDSAVINLLLATTRVFEQDGRRLELVVPPRNAAIGRIFDVLGVSALLTLRETLPSPPGSVVPEA
jgi:hypothetical protein